MVAMNIGQILAFLFAALMLVGTVVGHAILAQPDTFFLCRQIDCFGESVRYGMARPLAEGVWPLALVFLVLGFVPRKVLVAWVRIFLPLGALALLLILASDPVPQGFFPGPFPERTTLTVVLVRVFALASAFFIVYRLLRFRGRAPVKKRGY